MAIEYVNLSLPSTGGDGSVGDPWTGDSFVARHKVAPAGTDFRLQGSYTSTNIADFYQVPDSHHYKSWDLNLYGPWRISSAPISGSLLFLFLQGLTIEGGIIYSQQLSITITGTSISNCYFRTDAGSVNVASNDIKGVLINCASQIHMDNPGDIQVVDSVFYYPTDNNFYSNDNAGTLTFTNCAFNKDTGFLFQASQLYKITLTDCQTGWSNPTLPAWDGDETDFSVSTILAGVATPPQPGNPPYTGYTTDLWGNARTGIGTGFMGSTSNPPSWASTYPKLSTITPFSVKVLAEIDQDGTVYYVKLAHGATAPTSAEIKATPDGSVAVTANVEGSITISALETETTYDIYVVAENGSADLQASPELLEVTTASIPPSSQFTSEIFVGMPPKGNFTGASLQHSDTNRGNPHGNINDNSNGHNPVLDVLPRDSKLGNLNGNAVDNSAGNNPVDGLTQRWVNGNVPPIPKWLNF